MKVLYVDQTGQLGGGELSLLDVIKNSTENSEIALFSDGPFRQALEAIPMPVHLLSLGRVSEIRREARLLSVLRGGPALLKLRSQLAQLAARFDVLYANSQKAFLVSALARRQDQILVWHLRDMLTADHFSPFLRRVAVFAGNLSATVVVANSEATRESFIQAGGNPTKAVVVYNGIDPAPFDGVQESEVEAVRKALGLQDKYVVGCFGRITSWKAQHVVIESLMALPDTHAIIVGEALFGETAYSEKLQALVHSLGIQDRVHFLGFRRDIPLLMKLVDVVIHSSTAPEPFGRVLVEAMLAGTPVIATRAGGALEIIGDGETGLLVTPGSVQELSAAVTKLKNDPEFACRLALAGRQRATDVFSINAMIESIHSVLSTAHA